MPEFNGEEESTPLSHRTIVPDESPVPQSLSDEELLAQISERIQSQGRTMNARVFALRSLDNQMLSIDAQIEALRKVKTDLKDKKTAIERERWDLSKAIKADEKEKESTLRKLSLAEAEKLAKAKADEQRGLLADLIERATWGKRALPHQIDGMHYMTASRRVLCGDEMGTGKTLQSIMTVEGIQELKEGGKKTLIIAPGELCSNFLDECDMWAPELLVISLANLGTAKTLEDFAFWSKQLDEGNEESLVILINYEILARTNSAVLKELIAWQPDTVICDEAHRMKEIDRNTFQAVKQIVHAWNTCPQCGEFCFSSRDDGINYYWQEQFRKGQCPKHGEVQCVRSVQNFIAMSGTFILNGPDEMYASLHLARDDMFTSFNDYIYDYAYKDYNGRYVWQYGGESRLVNRIKGMYIRRTVHDAGIVLPPQKIQVHELKFDAEAYPLQAQLLRDLVKNALMQIDEGKVKTVNSMLALITRQRQATVWPGGIYLTETDPWTGVETRVHVGANYLESQKLDWACEQMDKYDAEGVRYVVMSLFREPLIELGRRRGDDVVEFHGGTPRELRAEIKINFDRVKVTNGTVVPKWKGVLAHYQLGGEGLNLTDATQMIILDEQWNPGKNEQAYKRTQRMGQTEETAVHIPRMIGSGCMDVWMAALNEAKRKVVEGFNSELSFQDLVDVFNQSL